MSARTDDLTGLRNRRAWEEQLPYSDGQLLVERLRAAMPDDQTVSAGVAEWDGSEPHELLLGRADRAFYTAKKMGRARLYTA